MFHASSLLSESILCPTGLYLIHVSCFVLAMVPFRKYPFDQPLGTRYVFSVSSFGECRYDKKENRPRWTWTQDPIAPSLNSYPHTRGDFYPQQQKYKDLCKVFHVSSFMSLDSCGCVITCFMFPVSCLSISLSGCVITCFMFRVYFSESILLHVSCY